MKIRPLSASEKEPTIALINIVFLMLIFFMIAGTLAPVMDSDLTLIRTHDLEGREPPQGLVVHADGRMTSGGTELADAAAYVDTLDATALAEGIRLIPDQNLTGQQLMKISSQLRAAGAKRLFLVTERALQ